VHEVNAYDNIYFEICNEPFGNLPEHASADEVTAWVRALAQVVRDEESKLPKRHLIFQDVVRRLRGASPLESIFEEPLLDGANCHSGELLSYGGTLVPVLAAFMRRELNLAAIIALWNASSAASKPFVFDEDNSCSNGLDVESWTVHRKRAWATVCSGGHYDMIDFSIQVGGQETGTPAAQAHIRTWMKHLSAFIHSVDFVHTAPARDFCTQAPPHTIAAALVNPGVEVVIYLADRREVGEPGLGQACTGPLAFSLPAGSYQARLYDPVQGRYTGEPWDLSGGEVTLTVPPFVHDVVLHIQVVQRNR